MTNIALITLLNIGFSIVVAILLFVSYTFFLKSSNKSLLSIVFCTVFLIALTSLQFAHLDFLTVNSDPLESKYYRFILLLVPSLFYFFSRYVLFVDYQFKLKSLIHFLPLLVVFLFESHIAIPVAFVIGFGYCLWLSKIIFDLRGHRKSFEIEFFFMVFFTLFAIGVLILGFSVSYIDNAYFYYFYANGIGLAYILVTTALIIYPDLLNELTAVVKLSYSRSTLSGLNIKQNIEKLNQLMYHSKIYQNENLNLSLLAESMKLSSHQLSELINTEFAVSFSRYIREQRIQMAKELLTNEPQSSILAISLQTGFKSQSNFYAAFKEITGHSPGHFRTTQP